MVPGSHQRTQLRQVLLEGRVNVCSTRFSKGREGGRERERVDEYKALALYTCTLVSCIKKAKDRTVADTQYEIDTFNLQDFH